jgi:hypothetical protein
MGVVVNARTRGVERIAWKRRQSAVVVPMIAQHGVLTFPDIVRLDVEVLARLSLGRNRGHE